MDEHAHQVVARVLTPRVAELRRVLEELHQRGLRVVGIAVVRVVETDQPVRPIEEQPAVLARHAEELGEHEQRQLRRHVRHEVALAFRRDGVDDLPGEPADPLVESRDRLRLEGVVDRLPERRVLRRIHVDHLALEHGQVLRPQVRVQRRAALGGEEHVVLRDRGHVGVAGDDPEAALLGLDEADGPLALGTPRVPVHRLVVAEPAEVVVGNALLEGLRLEQARGFVSHGRLRCATRARCSMLAQGTRAFEPAAGRPTGGSTGCLWSRPRSTKLSTCPALATVHDRSGRSTRPSSPRFRQRGYVLVPDLLTHEEIERYGGAVDRAVAERTRGDPPPARASARATSSRSASA